MCLVTDKKVGVLETVQEALRSKNLKYSVHALDRMDERSITVFEVEEIIKYGDREELLDEFDLKFKYWRYVIRNRDVNDRDLAISVEIEDANETVVVTVMQIDPQNARRL